MTLNEFLFKLKLLGFVFTKDNNFGFMPKHPRKYAVRINNKLDKPIILSSYGITIDSTTEDNLEYLINEIIKRLEKYPK